MTCSSRMNPRIGPWGSSRKRKVPSHQNSGTRKAFLPRGTKLRSQRGCMHPSLAETVENLVRNSCPTAQCPQASCRALHLHLCIRPTKSRSQTRNVVSSEPETARLPSALSVPPEFPECGPSIRDTSENRPVRARAKGATGRGGERSLSGVLVTPQFQVRPGATAGGRSSARQIVQDANEQHAGCAEMQSA